MEESKKCTQCKRTLLLEQFRMNKRTGQVTKQCIKCLDIAKKNKEKNISVSIKNERMYVLNAVG